MAVKDIMDLPFPDDEVDNIHEIDYENLAKEGKEGIIFDLDNTLSPWQQERLDKEVTELFWHLRDLGFRIGILTNGNGSKVRSHLQNLSYPVIFNASKPRRKGFKQMLNHLEVTPEQAVMIGDQLLTDVLGANRLNIHSILVRPVKPGQEYLLTKINRVLENLLLGGRKIFRFLGRLF